MPSSSSDPQFNLTWIATPIPAGHPALISPDPPFTLTQVAPGNYQMTFLNSLEKTVRIFCQGFAQPGIPLWSPLDMVLVTRSSFKFLFPKSVLGGAATIWLGAWWDDGTYTDAAAFFADHPAGGGHHTVPVTTG
jgi:hypothetical protein